MKHFGKSSDLFFLLNNDIVILMLVISCKFEALGNESILKRCLIIKWKNALNRVY